MITTPFCALVLSLRPEWIEAGHLGVAYYLLVFDRGTDAFREHAGLGRGHLEATDCGMVVAEAHLTYRRPVGEADVVRVRTRLLGVDGRRLHVFHEMRMESNDDVASTCELMLVHFDRQLGRSVPFGDALQDRLLTIAAEHARHPLPREVGSVVTLDRGKR